MIRTLSRALIAAIAVLALAFALRLWIDPALADARLGVAAHGLLGLATVRADVAGFFAGAGVLALAAAVRDDRRLLTAPLLLIGLALCGRLVTLAHDGVAQPEILPAAVEAGLLALFGLGGRGLGPR